MYIVQFDRKEQERLSLAFEAFGPFRSPEAARSWVDQLSHEDLTYRVVSLGDAMDSI
jgi:hypothetical protein